MLRIVTTSKSRKVGGHFAIVASNYNARYVDSMVKSARAVLKKAGAETIEVIRVPGAFEIPSIASTLAHRLTPRVSAILCLGVIFRGATTHAQHIGESVTHALASLQILCRLPVIHEVLLLENEDQAKERCLGARHNRGAEAAQTALTMVAIMRTLA